MKKQRSKFLIFLPVIFLIFSCDAWMKSDGFFDKIDEEVFVANAEKINVNIRYANTTQGSTSPNGSATFKVKVTSDISCVTNTAYGFHHWAAFSSEYFDLNAQNGQNKSIIYVSGEGGYEETILENELDENVVVFSDKTSPSTKVTIQTKRDDIVLVPVVAERPTISQQSPQSGASNIVRNTTLRYIFTKRMDLDSFSVDNIKITSGPAVLTDLEIPTTDITDFFIWEDGLTGTRSPVQSDTGKMLKFTPKVGTSLSSNQTITVYLMTGIKDEDGYEMETEQKPYFTTGTSVDSLAPRLDTFVAGIGNYIKTFDKIIQNANGVDVSAYAFDTDFEIYLKQRASGDINIYIIAADLAGEGSNAAAETDEQSVSLYGIRAKLLYDADGNKVNSSLPGNSIAMSQNAYVMGGNLINHDIIDLKEGGKYPSIGLAFNYDLSSLPDGLVQLDVWAVDEWGNSGFDETYYNTHNNGYKTMVIVKDTTPPDIAVESKKVISKSSDPNAAPYGWYNRDSIGTTTITLADKNKPIVDLGHSKLNASSDDIKWIFTVGDDPATWHPSVTDSEWKLVKDGAYVLDNITEHKEGAVGILMALMDDIGNLSEPVKLDNAVMFDSGKPEIGKLSWVDASENEILPITKSATLSGSHYLKVPFTESLSGLRLLAIELDGVNYTTEANKEKMSFYYNNLSTKVNHTIATHNGKTYAVLAPPENSQGYSSGVIFIGGLSLGASAVDGSKEFKVSVIDAALNDLASPSSEKNTLVYDKTAPEVESVVINEVISDGSRKWLKKDAFTVSGENRTPNKASIKVTAIETTSGIETIKLSGVNLTSNTKLYLGSSASGSPISCTVDETAGTITLPYNSTPVLRNSEKVVFTITGISFTKNIDNGKPNQIDVQLTDFSGNSKQKTDCDNVYIDSKSSVAPGIVVSDSASAFTPANNFWEWSNTKSLYTDSDTVEIIVKLIGDSGVDSGIKSITFTNVKFDSGTTVTPSAAISASTITFNDILDVNETITITGAKIIDQNQSTVISVSSTDLIGWSSGTGTDTILHDNKKPEIKEKPQWISKISGGINGITDNTNQNEADIKQRLKIPYVETGSGIKVIRIDGAEITSAVKVYNGDDTVEYTAKDDAIVFANPVTSTSTGGNIFVDGLSLSNPVSGDNNYTVTVSLFDIAENNDGAATGNTATICVDTTAPVLDKIEFPQIKRIKHFGESIWRYFFDKDCFANNITMKLYITETTSGIRTISFKDSLIKPTSSSTIKMTNDGIDSDVIFTLNGDNIEFDDNLFTEIRSDTSFTLEITNCGLANIRRTSAASEINTFSISLTDFAGNNNSSSEKTTAKYSDNSDISQIIANDLASVTPEVVLTDNEKRRDSENNLIDDIIKAKDTFTNYEIVNATITVPSSTSNNEFNELELTANAEFIISGSESTSISVTYGGTAVTFNVGDYEITSKKIKFPNYSFAPTSELKIDVTNLKLTGAEGKQTVTATTIAPTSKVSAAGGYEITLDKTPPLTNGVCSYSAKTNKIVYPRVNDDGTPTYGVKFTPDGIPYFYTNKNGSSYKRLFDIIERDPSGSYKKVDDNDYFIKISTTATTAAGIYGDSAAKTEFKNDKITIEMDAYDPADAVPYSYILYDEAGNYSEPKSFYLVKDESFNDSIITGPVYNPATYSVFKQSNSYYIGKEVAISITYPIGVKPNTDSGIAVWGIAYSDSEIPSTLNEYTSGNIIFNLQDYIDASELKTLYLYLKDNVGNITRIPLKDGSNVVAWQNTSPPVFTPKLEVCSSSNHDNRYGNLATEPVGDVRFINYYDRGVGYEISVQYSNNNCLYDEDGVVLRSTSAPTSDYTVRARLHWVPENAAVPSVDNIINATSCVSDWYYSKNKSVERNITLNFLKKSDGTDTDFAPSTKYKLYLLIENAAGDAVVKQVSIANSEGREEKNILCKDNTPPVINSKTILSANTSGVYQKEGDGDKFFYHPDAAGTKSFTINKSAITEEESGVWYLRKGDTQLADNATTVTYATTAAENSFTLSAVDQTRNESAPVTIYLYRDNTKPTISDFTVEETDGVHNDDADYYFNSNDTTGKSIGIKFKVLDTRDGTNPGSGVKEVTPSEVTYDSSTEYYNLTIPLTGISTTKKIDIAATDNVGFVSETKKISVIPDGTGPTFGTGAITLPNTDNVFFKSGEGYFYKPGTSISFNVTTSLITDNVGGSGFDNKLVYTISESDTATELPRNEIALSGTSFTISTTSSDNANKYIKIYAVDNVGNESATPLSFTIIPDGAAPEVPSLSSVSATDNNFYPKTIADWTVGGTTKGFFKGTATVTFASDGDNDGSGIEGIYEWNEAQNKIGDKLTSNQKSVTDTSTVIVVAKDNVGNVSAPFTVTLTKDATEPNKPTLSSVSATEIHPKTAADWTVSGSTGGYFRGDSATITFAATDNTGGCGIEGIYEWNEAQDKIGDKLTSNQKAVDATSTITVVAKDNLGNISDKFIVAIKQDNTNPTIEPQELSDVPADKKYIYLNDDKTKLYYNGGKSDREGKLKFTVTDGSSGPNTASGFFYSTNSSLSSLPTGQVFITEYDLAGKTLTGNQYFYTADNVGNLDKYTLNFVDDSGESGKPTITIGATDVYGDKANCYTYVSASKELYFNAGSVSAKKVTEITINFTASDSVSDVADVSTDYGTLSGSDGTYTITITSIPTANKDVTITVTDNVGNTKTETITLIPDGDAPTISIPATGGITATPASGVSDVGEGNGYHLVGTDFYYNSTKVTSVTFTPTANETVTYTFSGETGLTVTPNADNTACTVTPANNGTLTITAKDIVGNSSIKTITFKVDDTGPTISIPATGGITATPVSGVSDVGEGNGYHFASNTFYYNSTKIAKVTFTPAVTGGEDVTYDYTGGDYTSATDIVPADGKKLKITAKDKVGNPSNEIEITFTKNDTNPTISIPATGGITATAASGVSDVGEGNGYHFASNTFYYNSDKVAKVTFTPTVTGGEDVTYTYSGDYSSATDIVPADGKKLKITAKDNVGNSSNEIEITFTEDNDGPTIESYGITATAKTGVASVGDGNGYYLSGTTLYFNSDKVASVTFNPTVSGGETVTFTYSDGTNTVTDTVEPADDGTIIITVQDTLGNPTEKTITFKEANTNSVTISASITGYATISSTDFTSGSHIYFRDNSPATPATISFATASAPACGLKDGIYIWTGTATNGTLSEDDLKLTAEKEFTVVVVDNVGNPSSPFIITVTPDNAAPEPKTKLTGVKLNSIDESITVEGVSSPTFTNTPWFNVRDSIYGGATDKDWENIFYPAGTTATFAITSDAAFEDTNVSTKFSYGFTYGKVEASYTTAPATWTPVELAADVLVKDGDDYKLTVPLPSEGAPNSYLFIWFKDLVENVSGPYLIPSAEADGKTWIGQYTPNVASEISFTYDSSDNGAVTINGLSRANGVKSITFKAISTTNEGVTTYSDLTAYSKNQLSQESKITFACVGNGKTSYSPTSITNTPADYNYSSSPAAEVTITFGNSYAPSLGSITLKPNWNPATTCPIASIVITDVKGETVEIPYVDPATLTSIASTRSRMLLPDAAVAVVSTVTDAITSTTSNITHSIANFFIRNMDELPSNTEKLSEVSEIAENPVLEKIEKSSLPKQKAKKKQTKPNANVIAPEMPKLVEDVIDTVADEILNNVPLSDYENYEIDVPENLTEENITLAENNLIEYNNSEQVLADNYLSKLVLAIVAIVVAFAASISLAVILLLKKRQIK